MKLTIDKKFQLVSTDLGLDLDESYAFKTELMAIKDQLLLIMGDDAEFIRNWMHRPQKGLSQNPPASLIFNKSGITQILAMLRKELEMDSRIG